MTVSTAYTVLSFAGNGSTTAFAVSWPFLTGSLVVTLVASTGVETTQTLGTHYTVSGGTDSNGLPAVGTVTMITAPASGQTLRIARATPKTQATTWGENDAFPQKTIEAALDKLLLIAQEGSNPGTVNDGIGGDVMELVTSGATDYWDAESQIIRNVADPTADQDAVTKAYGDENYGGAAATAAAASATEAATSATNASTSASAASTSATNASTSATNASTSATNAATSATNASTSATAAAASATDAQNAANAIAARLTFSSTTTASDPGAGTFRFNHATPASATALYIDNADAAGATISGWVDTWDDIANAGSRGTLYFRGVTDNADLLVANVTGSVTDSTGYRTVTITGVAGSGAFTNGEEYLVQFAAAGADGAGGGDFSSNTATSVDGELVLFSGTGGKTGKRATTTGLLKAASGVVSAATAGTDYLAPGSVGFRAHKGGTDQTGVADSTFTKVTFGTEVYDNGGYFASSAWTPPAGLVSISAAFLASGTWSAGAQIAISIRKNASTLSLAQANWYSAAANAGGAFISVEDDANGTDYYEVFAYVDVGSGTATIAGTSNNTYFVGHVIK